ncbi:MAG TPA: XrtA system polysaccharide deacetylase [Phycisphaerae bacterium]|nr:XrtA system polysaccharide deacetylase [Phycisphaerae bacterium]
MPVTAPPRSSDGTRRHVLSFDVEEYFHVEAAAATVRPADWDGLASRLAPPVDRILDLLAEHDAAATFFVLGWVARKQPGLVARIARAGHEIASHGMSHQMIQRLDPSRFREEIIDSRKLLEDIASAPVAGFRAPTFSLTHKTAWAIDELAAAGYEYDSSVFPVRHDRYGVPEAPRWAHRAVGPGGGSILEVPPLTLRAGRANLPVGGGGYLRLFPIHLIGLGLDAAGRAGQVGVVYAHPWEFDPGQPLLPMGRLTRWRHRVNLHRTESKVRWLLRNYDFCDFRRCMGALRSAATEQFLYGTEA